MQKIMIVEDDITLQLQLSKNLKNWGYDIVTPNDFKDIVSSFQSEKPDLLLLDVTLPYFDGFYWCQKIRELSKVPIIFLSSRDSNMDILMALNNGADDYVSKPFSMAVLIGKIQAILRRAYSYAVTKESSSLNVLTHNGLVLKLEEGIAYFNDERIDLTKNELKILSFLMGKTGKIISRNDLMNLLWDNDIFVNDNTLTVNINRLRAKLEDVGLPNFITTKKGQGYVIL